MSRKDYRLNPRDREQERVHREIAHRRAVEDAELFGVRPVLVPEGSELAKATRPLPDLKQEMEKLRTVKPEVPCDRCDRMVNLDRTDTYVSYNIWNIRYGTEDDVPDSYIHFAHPKAAPRGDVIERVWCIPCASVILKRISESEV